MKSFSQLFFFSWNYWRQSFKLLSKWGLMYYVLPVFVLAFLALFISSPLMKAILLGFKGLIEMLLLPFVFLLIYFFLFQKQEPVQLAKRYYGKYLLYGFLFSLSVGVLFLFLLIPGLIALIYWFFGVFVFLELVLNGKGFPFREALRTSYLLVKGMWWRTLGFLLLEGIILAFFGFLVIGVLQFLVLLAPSFFQPFLEAGINLVNYLLMAFSLIFFYHMYGDYKQVNKTFG